MPEPHLIRPLRPPGLTWTAVLWLHSSQVVFGNRPRQSQASRLSAIAARWATPLLSTGSTEESGLCGSRFGSSGSEASAELDAGSLNEVVAHDRDCGK